MVILLQPNDSSFSSAEHSTTRIVYRIFPTNCHSREKLYIKTTSLLQGTFLALVWLVDVAEEAIGSIASPDSSSVVSMLTDSRCELPEKGRRNGCLFIRVFL